eukprot:CAMPEP_0201537224 /NCGR_PEP_ID=MMETSP0161_2-20130828/64123_1 /ASSEMBLY_ACC=CAM_ASM_000251 /TAXON_ID=180227 /ORGANISM="Neoparamoeba aestuarina, Strain SoJaBio B1-5/56/2" /LENGTH=126 /DNA_ID=CAMNT_0047943383 /DNA_START=11 /DNA_END=388 /DNA_ORIENTATION=-
MEGLLLIFNDSMLVSEKAGAERYELRFVMKWESLSTLCLAEIALLSPSDGNRCQEARLLVHPPRIKKGVYSFTKCNTEQLYELISEQLRFIRAERNLVGDLKHDFASFDSGEGGIGQHGFLAYEGW